MTRKTVRKDPEIADQDLKDKLCKLIDQIRISQQSGDVCIHLRCYKGGVRKAKLNIDDHTFFDQPGR